MAAEPGMVWTSGIVAFVAAVPLWRFTTHAITIAHEGAHALFGTLFGLAVKAVKMSPDGSGSTRFQGDSWFGLVLGFGAGYLGPSVFGFAGAWMLVHDFAPRSVLLLSLAFVALELVMIRSLFGLLAVPLTGAVLWAVAMHATAEAQLVFAYIWVWFLLMGGARQIPELYRSQWQAGKEPDTKLLADKTGCSTAFFVAFFWLGSMGALIGGGAMMLRDHA
jgi:hypothetical protein